MLRFADRKFYEVSLIIFLGLVELQKSYGILEALEPSRSQLVYQAPLQPYAQNWYQQKHC